MVKRRSDENDDSVGEVRITSEPDEKGHYHVVIETDQDTTFPMDATNAYAWAREVLSAVAAAQYDAALVKQLRHMDVPDEGVGLLLGQVRAAREQEVPLSMVPGLSMTPGVSIFTGEGFLHLRIKGELVGQWELNDAVQHAVALMMALEVAVLDGAYLRALMSTGMDRETAQMGVAQLMEFRD